VKSVLIAIASVLLLSGCTGTPAPKTSTAPASSVPAATYKTVDALRVAFTKAGGDCSGWVASNPVKLAAQSGDCSGSTVLSTYLSSASRDQVIVNLKSFGNVHLLVGENWIINTPSPEPYADALAGTVVISGE
jgi:hypothetical protein